MGRRNKTLALGLAASSVGFLGAAEIVQRDRAGSTSELLSVANGTLSADEAVVDREIAWDLPSERNERVDFWLEFLSGQNYDNTRKWLERVGTYGPMIHEQLAERDMPMDLLYLAMIESGLSPHAYSHAHASGLWQFIAETGQRYGLEVSEYVDERNDPVKATTAALDYLEDLNERFEGSWFLAAASYNTGENRVERILNERAGGVKGDDAKFWEIAEYLPKETRNYVPLMIAMGHIQKDPEQFGFYGIQEQEPLAYDEVTVPGGTTLERVADASGVSLEAVKDLNAHLVKGMTPPDRTMQVRIPEGTTRTFASNFGPERTAQVAE